MCAWQLWLVWGHISRSNTTLWLLPLNQNSVVGRESKDKKSRRDINRMGRRNMKWNDCKNVANLAIQKQLHVVFFFFWLPPKCSPSKLWSYPPSSHISYQTSQWLSSHILPGSQSSKSPPQTALLHTDKHTCTDKHAHTHTGTHGRISLSS